MNNRKLHVMERNLFDAISLRKISSEKRLSRVKSCIKRIRKAREAMFDVKIPSIDATYDDGFTPLMLAVSHGDQEIVYELIAAGADCNKQNNAGDTALILAAIKNYKEIAVMLIKAGVNSELMDTNGLTALIAAMILKQLAMVNLLLSHNAKVHDVDVLHKFLKANHIVSPPYVTSAAFEPALEIKEDKGSPYGAGIACIEKYPKNGSNEERKPFEDQFNQLLDQYKIWGRKHGIYTFEIEQFILLLQQNFFPPSHYANKQEPIYFETIKKNLEKIMLLLQNDQISLEKRITAYHDLCNDFGNCAPGLHLHIEHARFFLSSNISLNYWLADFRTNIIKDYAIKYNTKHNITEIYSVHTVKLLTDDADVQNWNPAFSAGHVNDKYAPRITEKDRADFRDYFVREFNPTAIRQCIQLNLHGEMNKIFDTLGFNIKDEWKNSSHLNYVEFTKRATSFLKNLGIKSQNDIFDFIESNDDFTQFRLCEDAIVNILCERVLSPALYFDSDKKTYLELVPSSWVDVRQVPQTFNFSVWDSIPDKDLPSVLYRVLNVLPNSYIETLLENISLEKITKSKYYATCMANIYYATRIANIENPEKRKLVVDKISQLFLQGEYKNEKEEKTLNQHQFFQPGTNKMLDKLLLHVARGEQEQAEAIIKINPELIFQSGNVEDFFGNTFIDYSPCQLAAYAHDVDMLKMMKPYLNRVKNGEEQLCVIVKEADDASKNQHSYDFTLLEAAITHGNPAKIEEALQAFRKHFGPREIKNEKSFNLANLLHAYDIYINNYQLWSGKQCTLFWCQVIGYLQRSLPACYAQALCQGLYRITVDNQPLERQLKFGQNQSFYPSTEEGRCRLGFDFAIHVLGPEWKYISVYAISSFGCPEETREGTYSHLEKLYETKMTELRELVPEPNRINKRMKLDS